PAGPNMTSLRGVRPRKAWLAGSSGPYASTSTILARTTPPGRSRATTPPISVGATSSEGPARDDLLYRRATHSLGEPEEEHQQRLLGVQTILGLIPDRGVRPVEDRKSTRLNSSH